MLTNLSSKSVNDVLTSSDITLYLDNGASTDWTVRLGVIGGMENGTALTGSGGYITPASKDETDLTHTKDDQVLVAGDVNHLSVDAEHTEAVSVNQVRFDGNALKVNHVNGDTVKYVCVITSAGDICGKYVS